MKKLLIMAMLASFLAGSSCAIAGNKVKKEPISTEKKQKKESIKAGVIIPLKLEGLKWKLKYYQEKSLTAQLRSMILTWNKPEFQETQKMIRKTNKEIQRLLLTQ